MGGVDGTDVLRRIGATLYRHERIGARGNGEAARMALAFPKSRRVGRGRQGRPKVRAPAAGHEGVRGCVGGATGRLAWERADLAWRRTGGFSHRIQRQTRPRSTVIRHDQGRRPAPDLRSLTQGRRGGSDARGGKVSAVPSAVAALTSPRSRPCPARWSYPISADLTLKPCPGGSQ